jgi:PAS domain S-box-containing protein
MKIGLRITLLSVATLLVMTAAVTVAGVLLLEGALERSQERLLRLQLATTEQAIRQQLDRAGTQAAAREAQAQAERLHGAGGFTSGRVFVIDHLDFRVVHHTAVQAGHTVRDAHIEEMFRRGAGTLWYEEGGERRIAAFDTLQPIDWLVGVSVSRDEIAGARNAFVSAIGASAFAALGLSALAFGLFARGLIRRIRETLECVWRIEQGDLAARVAQPDSQDELGELQRGVNAMGTRIEQRTQEQLAAQAAQKASEAQLRRLVDSSIIGMFLWDLSGRVYEANDAFLDIIGYSRDDLLSGRVNWARLTPPADVEADRRAGEELREHGRCLPYEKRYIRKDGTLVPVLIGAVLFADSTDHGIAFVINITERRQADADRQARRDAEAASRAKSEFLAIMSHELRTPLNAVLGHAQILRREPQLTQRQRERLASIQASGEHLLSLINDLLDLAKIEAGTLELHLAPTSLAVVIESVAGIIRARAEEKRLDFHCEVDPALPSLVLADEQRLRQVLLNLLGDAIKFTDHGSVRLRVQAQPGGERGTQVGFEVTDTGIGMDAALLSQLFTPFEKVSESSRATLVNTGLGLAVSQRLVGLMGGRIQAESRPGRGSRFRFEIDLQPATAAVLAHQPALGAIGYEGPVRRILLAQGQAVRRVMVSDQLRTLGFVVDETAQGRQALEAAARHWPDLVLVEAMLPDMPGAELARELRRLGPQAGVAAPAIVMLSTADTPADYAIQHAVGADEVLYPPFDRAELLACIGRLLRLQWTWPATMDGSAAPAALPEGSMRAPPPHELSQLQHLARMGNMRQLRELADRLAVDDPSYVPLARRLKQLAANYQSKAILELVETLGHPGD